MNCSSYRANLWALKQLGVNLILATTAVGSLTADISRGTLVVLGKRSPVEIDRTPWIV